MRPNLPKIKLIKYSIAFAVIFTYVIFLAQAYYIRTLNNKLNRIETGYTSIQESQQNFEQNLPEYLFNEHLALIEKQKLEFEVANLESQIQNLQSTDEGSTFYNVDQVFSAYGNFQTKLTRNNNVNLETNETSSKIAEWGNMLINQDFENLLASITEQNLLLDEKYNEYIASLPPPPAPAQTTSVEGYSYQNVTTEKGTSHGVYLIKLRLSSVKVKTVAAISSDCSNDCPTKSLADYVSEYGGFAGINGSYMCPPDYSECAGKVNSFDFALYDSGNGKWINKNAISWSNTGMFTFGGGRYNFYKRSNEYGGGSVEAAISNFPSLLKDEKVVYDEGDLTSYQMVRGLRGVLGVGGENIYLAQITNATVEDAAYVMKALGAKHALNLDGGGTSAMYINGQYVVGPGRSLANAIVLTK
jgi:hypothetical protein